MWVRGPIWDSCFLLSGLPIGLALLFVAGRVSPWLVFGFAVISIQLAHTLSPMILAWTHREFRTRVAQRNLWKFVGLPITIGIVSTAGGYASSYLWPLRDPTPLVLQKIVYASHTDPIFTLGLIYTWWNIFHFGMQNFGVMSIYRAKTSGYPSDQRRFDLIFCCTMAWAAMGLGTVHFVANYVRAPILGFQAVRYEYLTIAGIGAAVMLWREWSARRFNLPRLILIFTNAFTMGLTVFGPIGVIVGLGTVSINHWLTAVGLSAQASGRRWWMFAIVLLVAGIGLWWVFFRELNPWHLMVPTEVVTTAVGFRLGFGVAHFLYDRWLYRNTEIKKALLCV